MIESKLKAKNCNRGQLFRRGWVSSARCSKLLNIQLEKTSCGSWKPNFPLPSTLRHPLPPLFRYFNKPGNFFGNVSLLAWNLSYRESSHFGRSEKLLVLLSFFRLVSGRNPTNPAIWLVPGAGGIFSYGPLQRAEYVDRVDLFSWFNSRLSSIFRPFHTFIDGWSTQVYFYSQITFRW